MKIDVKYLEEKTKQIELEFPVYSKKVQDRSVQYNRLSSDLTSTNILLLMDENQEVEGIYIENHGNSLINLIGKRALNQETADMILQGKGKYASTEKEFNDAFESAVLWLTEKVES